MKPLFNSSSISNEITNKNRVKLIKSVVERILKVGIKTSNVHEIISNVLGFKDYNTACAMKHVSIRKNVSGSDSNPLWVSFDFGYFLKWNDVYSDICDFLEKCDEFGRWHVFEDETEVNVYHTFPKVNKGYHYQMQFTGDTTDDVVFAMEEAINRIDNNLAFDNNESSSFYFQRVGKEFFPTDNHTFEDPSNYCVISKNKLLFVSKDEDEAIEKFESIEEFDDCLILSESLSVDYIDDNDDDIFHLYSTKNKVFVCHGDRDDIMEFLTGIEGYSFILYRETDRK